MKKNYKENIKLMGYSDCARLVLVTPKKAEFIEFNKDASYKAYIVDESYEIPEHYKLSNTAKNWAKVYDDEGLTGYFKADEINFFRAGDCGLIIQEINRR